MDTRVLIVIVLVVFGFLILSELNKRHRQLVKGRDYEIVLDPAWKGNYECRFTGCPEDRLPNMPYCAKHQADYFHKRNLGDRRGLLSMYVKSFGVKMLPIEE